MFWPNKHKFALHYSVTLFLVSSALKTNDGQVVGIDLSWLSNATANTADGAKASSSEQMERIVGGIPAQKGEVPYSVRIS